MKPLLFLSSRSFVNGIKRALTSPQRLIGLLVVVLYYVNFLFQPFTSSSRTAPRLPELPQFELPRLEVIDAGVFLLFSVLSLFLMMGALTPRGSFRPADVDVLFPTPVSPKIVLGFRLVREYVFTLLFPMLIAILSGRRGIQAARQFFQDDSGVAVSWQLLVVAWFLLSLSWVCLGFGLSMFVNRSDEQSDRNKKIINGLIFGSLIAAVVLVGFRLRSDYSWDTALDVAHHPLLRFVFFGSTFATELVMGPMQHSLAQSIVGVLALLSVAGVGLALAASQITYMYDQAAARGFDSLNLRKLQRSGDTYAMVAEQARQGRVKKGRVASWVSKQRVHGGAALLWKEMLLQGRGAMWQYWLMGPMVLFLVLVPLYGVSRKGPLQAEITMLLAFQAMGVFIITLNNATSGFIELLRRVDVQKPLPFTPSTIVFWEILAKCVPTTLISIVAAVGASIMDVRLWPTAAASVLLMPSLAMILTSVVLLVTILFPDMEDAAQRSFRGLMMLLGCAIVSMPGVAILGLLFYLKVHPLIAMLPVLAANVGITIAVAAIAGTLYAGFNPSE
ncbi:MAG TPA: putative ABC exporter domain-containing protein [Fimbriimonas sp.]|nr:putative ABC exporter domain-containing protein [Fimbriimonas sp.]